MSAEMKQVWLWQQRTRLRSTSSSSLNNQPHILHFILPTCGKWGRYTIFWPFLCKISFKMSLCSVPTEHIETPNTDGYVQKMTVKCEFVFKCCLTPCKCVLHFGATVQQSKEAAETLFTASRSIMNQFEKSLICYVTHISVFTHTHTQPPALVCQGLLKQMQNSHFIHTDIKPYTINPSGQWDISKKESIFSQCVWALMCGNTRWLAAVRAAVSSRTPFVTARLEMMSSKPWTWYNSYTQRVKGLWDTFRVVSVLHPVLSLFSLSAGLFVWAARTCGCGASAGQQTWQETENQSMNGAWFAHSDIVKAIKKKKKKLVQTINNVDDLGQASRFERQ